MISPPSIVKTPTFKHLTQASKVNKTYNGVAYNEKVKFAIIFKENSEVKTVFVDHSGFINGEWNYGYNLVAPEFMESVETVKNFLSYSKADSVFQIFGVELLE